MRNFATIPPSVWQTDVKKLRGDIEAIAILYHLTTSSHSTMIGIYPLPTVFLAHELGSPLEGASKGLRRVCEAGIATYDEESEIVWVHDMAASQVAPRLSPKDNRVVAVAKQLAALPICWITLKFYEYYRVVFHLHDQPVLEEFERAFQGAIQAPSDPLRSKDKEKEQEKDPGEGKGQSRSGEKKEVYPHARDEEPEHPFDPPQGLEEGKRMLERLGVPERYMQTALTRLMKHALFPCDVREWKEAA